MVHEGSEGEQTKAALLERLEALGIVTSDDPNMRVMANGERIDPVALGPMRFAFLLPAGRTDVALLSRTFTPAHADAKSTDPRSLGVCVSRLQIDGEDVALGGDRLDGSGWHELEPGRRWTRGRTALPAGARLVVIDLAGMGRYWQEPAENVVALFG